MDKRYIVLESLIEEYIESNRPVSSKKLQQRLPISISSATIRYYYKQLTQQGYLQKEHVSSGRIPTPISLKRFWLRRLRSKTIKVQSVESLKKAVLKEDSIFCEYALYENVRLQEVEPFKKRFIVAVFDNGEFIIPYSERIEKFLKEHIGKTAQELSDLFYSVGLISLAKSIKESVKEDFELLNVREILELAQEHERWSARDLRDLMSGEQLIMQKRGLYFNDDILTYKFTIEIDERRYGEMMLMGHLFRNYQKFLENLHKE